MTTRTFTAPAAGPLLFGLQAGAADIVITVTPGTGAATAELSGPDETVNSATDGGSAGRWTLTVPAPAPVVTSTGNTRIVNAGRGQVIQAGVIYGNITMIGGYPQVSGLRMSSDATVIPGPEPVRLDVTLPTGSRLQARLDSGTLTTWGDLPAATVTSASADIETDVTGILAARTMSGAVTARSVTGSARLETMSGPIRVEDAAGPVTASTVSGGIDITASAPVTIDAESMSGDITVRTGGADPDVRVHSVSGRTRITR